MGGACLSSGDAEVRYESCRLGLKKRGDYRYNEETRD